MYSAIRKILFGLDPEQSHYVALQALQLGAPITSLITTKINKPVQVMGMTFPNRVGVAAGLDKNADYVDGLSALGFGFIEIGTVTPKPQIGNPKPRLFRLVEQEAIINRMGFNNKGIDYVVDRLQKINYRGILGINIGKNKDTPNEDAVIDYLQGFRAFWKYASYITINISSPNTPGLRLLQNSESLIPLLSALKNEQTTIARSENKYVPLVVKISPDMADEELPELASILLDQKIDGVIATNTTLSRTGVESSPYAKEAGGLSGKPLCARNTQVIKILHQTLQDKIPIIAVGGIMDAASAQEKLAAGAKLLQVYTGFIYQGPSIIKACLADH
jgi:dihydroorotate dehydrogenase